MYRTLAYGFWLATTLLATPVAAMESDQAYVTVQGGVGQVENHDFTNTSAARVSTKLEQGYVVVGAVGRGFGKNFRGEVEGGYRASDVDNHSTTGPALAGSDGEARVLSGMVNGYYDLPTAANIKPYVGAGVGVASVAFENYSTIADGVILDQTETVPAVQGMAGLNAPITSRLSVNAEYRYFTTAKVSVKAGASESNTSYATHNVMLGARYAF